MTRHGLFGVAAQFEDAATLIEAVRTLHESGYRYMEAYSPYPVHQLEHYIPVRRRIPLFVLVGGLLGTFTAWSMQYYIAVVDYPTNIGGRPLNSWPSFIVIMFELTILFAGVTAFFSTLALCGFPRPHHPVFAIPNFDQATNNRFFVCVESTDPLFDREAIRALLANTNTLEVTDVAED